MRDRLFDDGRGETAAVRQPLVEDAARIAVLEMSQLLALLLVEVGAGGELGEQVVPRWEAGAHAGAGPEEHDEAPVTRKT